MNPKMFFLQRSNQGGDRYRVEVDKKPIKVGGVSEYDFMLLIVLALRFSRVYI